MHIRFVKIEDLPQLIMLCKAHADFERADYNTYNKQEALSKFLFGPNPHLKCLVVVQDDILIGYATFMKQFSTWDADFYIYLDCLYLKETARGRGLGHLIMAQIKTYAISQNCTTIQWQTPEFNTKAIDFYTKIGATSKDKKRFFFSTSPVTH